MKNKFSLGYRTNRCFRYVFSLKKNLQSRGYSRVIIHIIIIFKTHVFVWGLHIRIKNLNNFLLIIKRHLNIKVFFFSFCVQVMEFYQFLLCSFKNIQKVKIFQEFFVGLKLNDLLVPRKFKTFNLLFCRCNLKFYFLRFYLFSLLFCGLNIFFYIFILECAK